MAGDFFEPVDPAADVRLLYAIQASAGASGNVSATFTAADHWTAVMFALEEAAGAMSVAAWIQEGA